MFNVVRFWNLRIIRLMLFTEKTKSQVKRHKVFLLTNGNPVSIDYVYDNFVVGNVFHHGEYVVNSPQTYDIHTSNRKTAISEAIAISAIAPPTEE